MISSVLEQTDSVVYGVDVPGLEGKAGMAAIVEDVAKFDLDRFLHRIKAELPTYAIPIFIRLVSTLDITGRYQLFAKLVLLDYRNKVHWQENRQNVRNGRPEENKVH